MGRSGRRNARPSEVPEEKEEEKKMTSDTMTTTEGTQEEPVKYCTNLRASVETDINENPRAFVHSREWKKIMNGDPVEINPSVGHGPEDRDGRRVVREVEAQRRLSRLLGLRQPEHEGAPLHPDVVPRQQKVGERDPLPRLPQLLVEELPRPGVHHLVPAREGEVERDALGQQGPRRGELEAAP